MPVTVRPSVAALPVYRAGRPPAPVPGLTTYKLSSNENPYPPLPGVLAAVTEACGAMNRYPDAGNVKVLEALSSRFELPAERFALSTGSVGALYQLIQALCEPGDEVVYAWRSFEAYPLAVQVCGAVPVPVPLAPGGRHDLAVMRAAIGPRTKVVLLCSPNNPTGPALGHEEVAAFVDDVSDDVLVVVDEAYVEFVERRDAVRGLDLTARPNVAVLRTFSKAYGLAGFRVGFCIAEPTLALAVRATSLPFGVSLPAQAAAVASLAAEPQLIERVTQLRNARAELVAGLAALGFDLPDAQGNFVWFPLGPGTAAAVERFAAAGLSVRGYAVGNDQDGIRVTVAEPEANARVLEVAATLPR